MSRVLSQKLIFLSMVTAAAPVVIALGILLQTGQGLLPRYPSSAISVRQAMGRPVIPPVDAQNKTGSAVAGADLHLAVNPVEVRFPSLAPVSARSRFFSDPFAVLRYGTMRLQSPPPDGDLFTREILLSAASNSIPTPSANPNPEAVLAQARNINAHAAIVLASQANRIHGKIKAHSVAHHRHRRQMQGPVALLAKLGRSVMETLSRFVD